MIEIPWHSWYGDDRLVLSFPSEWEAIVFPPADGSPLSREAVERSLAQPVGSDRLETILKGKRTLAIALEDITRPLPAADVLSLVLQVARDQGIAASETRVIFASGAHRQMTKDDMERKIGAQLYREVDLHNHNPYDNVVHLGETAGGTPIGINRDFMEAEVKIGIGSICPHGGPGFGGGAKIVIPGVAGIETIRSIHRPGRFQTGIGMVDGNGLRAEIEEAVRRFVTLDFVVDGVVNSRKELAGLFAGHPVEAHRQGVAFARGLYSTAMPGEAVDIAVCNAYPKDTDFGLRRMALNVIRSAAIGVVKGGGTIVIVTASPEGRGFHGLYSPGMRYYPPVETDPQINAAETVIFSPHLKTSDTDGMRTFCTWDVLVEYLRHKHGGRPRVAVFPCGSLQLAATSSGDPRSDRS